MSRLIDASIAEHREFCSDALCVQDACNITAIVGSLSRHLIAIGRADSQGEESRRSHPATVLYLSKLCSLLGGETAVGEAFSKAYDDCQVVENGVPVAVS